MHATTFALKRGHLLSLTMLRGELKPFAALGITPARADVLNLIRATHPLALPQRDVAKRLGVTRATISRMLIRLEAMGIIVRPPHPRDRRQKLVVLSLEGVARLRIIVQRIMNARIVDRALRTVFRAAPGEMRRPHATLLTDLRTFAGRLGDTATSPYVARVLGERPARWPFPSARPSSPGGGSDASDSRPLDDWSDVDEYSLPARRVPA